MSKQQKEKFLLKVRVSDDGTINGDDLCDERCKIIDEEKTKLYFSLQQFNDIVNQLDARFFDEIKDKIFTLIKALKSEGVNDSEQMFEEVEDDERDYAKDN